MLSIPTSRPHAALTSLDAPQLRWAGGFWGDVLERCRELTVPTMWQSLSDPTVSPAWRNFLIAAGAESGEHGGPPFLDGDLYKWLEAAISLLATGHDAALEAVIEQVVDVVASIQRDDGYIHTPTLIAARNHETAEALTDRFNFETYNLGHLLSAAVAHHRVTGRSSLLDVARRAAGFLEQLAERDPDALARSAICPSHYLGVVELYRETSDARWLRLAERFVEVRDRFSGGDDNQDRIAVRDQRVVAGHAVRANYLYAGLADLVAETGDQPLLDTLTSLWRDVVETKLYLTGGCGALYDGASPDGYPHQGEISRVHQAYGRPYQLPNTTAHNESCANIGMMMWSQRMAALTGDVRYADVVERIAFNSLLASIGLDAGTYSYTNPLRQVRELPFPLRRPGDTALRPVPEPPPSDRRLRQRYMSCFCCPPNIARTLAQLHSCAASVSADGLWLHQYGNADVDVDVGLGNGGAMQLAQRTEYPWDGVIELTVIAASGDAAALHLRIPGWSAGATITVNDAPAEQPLAGSYAVIERVWQAGDRVVVDVPMPVRMQTAHRLAEEVTNQVAVTRGPLVYCLESCDLPDGTRLEQVALRRGTSFTAVPADIAGHPVVVLDAEAVVLPIADGDRLYADVPDGELTTIPLRLVPYFAWGNRGPSEMSVWLPLLW